MARLLPRTFADILNTLGVIGAVGTFLFGVVQWSASQHAQREQQAQEILKSLEQRRIEAQKPFLDRQLLLYTEAVRTTASIAVLGAGSTRWSEDAQRFWLLYWGELAIVENQEVEAAMVKFGKALGAWQTEGKEEAKASLRPLSLDLARAIRRSLDQSWGIRVWTSNR